MIKQICLIFIAILLFTSFTFSTKLVLDVSDQISYKKTLNANFNKNDRFDIKSKFIMVSDEDYESLKKNKKVKLISDLNHSSIVPFQSYSVSSMNVNTLWTNNITGEDLLIGIVDSGISYSSDAIADKIFAAEDFTSDDDVECIDLNEHGCLVSSILAGYPLGDLDNKGVAYDANLVSAKIFNSNGNANIGAYTLYDVFDWVTDNDAIYINNSWGTPKYTNFPACNLTGYLSNGEDNAEDWDIYDYAKYLEDNEILLVFSSGNSGQCESEKTLSNDCSAYNNICVGSVSDNDTLDRSDDSYSYFSSAGPTDDLRKKPDLVAPGQAIYSYNYNSTQFWNGTSASSPHVTASAALLSQLGLTPLEVKTLLINSSDDINDFSWDKYTGWGYINLDSAYDQKDFVNTFDFNNSNYISSNEYSDIIVNDNNEDYFVLDSDENTKCSLVWRRVFDNSWDPYLQNYDLYLTKSGSTNISDSEIDNVEQVVLNDDLNNAYLKLSCLGDCYSSSIFNYALACNVDYNKVNLDYYPEIDENFYLPLGDGNYSLYFDFNSISNNINPNVSINSMLYNDYILDNNYISENISDINISFDFNSDLNLSNLLLDANIDYVDFNSIINVVIDINNQNIDANAPSIVTNSEDIYYLENYNSNILDFNTDDNYLYYSYVKIYLDSDLIYTDLNYTDQQNKTSLDLQLDLNQFENYDLYSDYNVVFGSKDVFGNHTFDNFLVYNSIVLDLNNSYLDYPVIYYKYDLEDLNLIFDFNLDYDYNLLLFDSNSILINNYSFNKSDVFFYNFDLNNVDLISIKNITNDLDYNFNLVQDLLPEYLTTSITKDFNIIIYDFDLNYDSLDLNIDSSPVDYSIENDNNYHYVSGTGSSSSGSHLLEITVCDYSNNCVDQNYTYNIQRRSSGGSGSSGSSIAIIYKNNSENIVGDNKTINSTKSINEYTFSEIVDLNDSGNIVVDNKFSPMLTFYDSNNNLLTNIKIKIFDNNNLIYYGTITNNFILDNKYLDKNLLAFGYLGDKILFKQNLFIPKMKSGPSTDVNTETIVPFANDLGGDSKSSKNYIWYVSIVGLFVVILLSLIIFVKATNRLKLDFD